MLWEKHKLAIINNYTASNSCITLLLLQNVSFIAHAGTSQTGVYTCIYFLEDIGGANGTGNPKHNCQLWFSLMPRPFPQEREKVCDNSWLC